MRKVSYVKCRVMIHEYTNGELAIFHGARKLAKYDASGKVIVELDKKVDSVSVAA
ncbi:MAG: hypothetical protein QMO91_06980 [Candidatus Tisiphia sp.]|nr:hypothetical protein [Candidatus Tisiphia sp.]